MAPITALAGSGSDRQDEGANRYNGKITKVNVTHVTKAIHTATVYISLNEEIRCPELWKSTEMQTSTGAGGGVNVG